MVPAGAHQVPVLRGQVLYEIPAGTSTIPHYVLYLHTQATFKLAAYFHLYDEKDIIFVIIQVKVYKVACNLFLMVNLAFVP